MFNTTIFKRDKKTKTSFSQLKNNLKAKWFSNPNHAWIKNSNKTTACCDYFIDSLNETSISQILNFPKNISLIKIDNNWSYSISNDEDSAHILLFSDFIKFINNLSVPKGAALFAHEIAKIIFYEKKLDEIALKMVADAFVCGIGLGNELQDILLECRQTETITKRINHLTFLLQKSDL